MKFNFRLATVAGGAVALALAAACNPDLNVTNPNQPDVARAISSGSDVRSLIGSSYNTVYLAMQGNGEPDPGIATGVMADVFTMAFGNFGARFNGQEPRLAYNNSSAATDGRVASDPYNDIYGALGAANDGLKAIKNGVRVAISPSSADETQQMQAFAWLVQGMALGFESQVYDKGFVVTEDSEGTATLVDYKAMRDAALVSLGKAITAASGKTWTISSDFTTIDLNLTAPNMVKMANTLAARVLAYNARNATENAATDWARVLTYANAGISTGSAPFDLTAEGDGGNVWYDHQKGYADLADGSWVRVDQRIIQEASTNNQPTEWTSTTPPPFPVIPDLRFAHGTPNAAGNIEPSGADFWFEKSVPYAVARGVYFWSQWSHARYINQSFYNDNPLLGPAPYVLQAENDLLIAEALVRTNGDLARAASLINKTRVGRGGLPAVTAATSKNELLGAIFYERDVELFDTGGAQGWFDRRRIDPTVTYNGLAIGNIWAPLGGTNLQKGTPRHLPLPAKELETLGMTVYTYGGASPNPVFPEQ